MLENNCILIEYKRIYKRTSSKELMMVKTMCVCVFLKEVQQIYIECKTSHMSNAHYFRKANQHLLQSINWLYEFFET